MEKSEGMSNCQWMSLKKACSLIRGCLADVAFYLVLEERTPKGFWSKLQILYMDKNMCNKLMLKKQLYNLQMQESGDVVVQSRGSTRYTMSC